MTSLQRVLTTLGHQEPDRVPFFLLVTMHGAREMGVSIREYYSRPELVAGGQLRMRQKYRHDCLYGFFYAAVEVEARGGEVLYYDDGPPIAGEPIVRRPEDILSLTVPRIQDCPCLVKVLEGIRQMKNRVGDEAPIIGVVMSPFSAPVMQMGFEAYLDVLLHQPKLYAHLMAVNENFCVEWSNAQLRAGATAICYFDPVSSPTNIPRALYLDTGYPMARRTLKRIPGAAAIHMASGRCASILEDLATTGAAVVGVSALEDLAALKAICRGKVGLLGNLNGLEMRRWNASETEQIVKTAIAKAGPGGGFILSDNHGEIPWHVPETTLLAISETVHQWGQYPLRWVERA